MKIILIVILVSNGRFYHEEPVFFVEHPTEQSCLEAASKYAVRGINYTRTMCVPKVQLPKSTQ